MTPLPLLAATRRIRSARRIVTPVVALGMVLGLAVTGAPSAGAATVRSSDIDASVDTWDAAAARLGTAGSLWEPARTAGLSLRKTIRVLADNLTFEGAKVTSGDTFAGGTYTSGRRVLYVNEKWANTGWSAEPAYSTSMAKVGSASIPLGLPGTRIRVVAQVYANCFPQSSTGNPKPVPTRFRCSRSDVLRTGGVLVMTARPASQMTAPGDTSIVLMSTGLTYTQLVAVASSLQQVAGATGDGAGSAQMIAMCRAMVDGRMTSEQATAYAVANGYSARVGSIDGQPMAVTMDFRPDRFTLAVTAGAVTACTYG